MNPEISKAFLQSGRDLMLAPEIVVHHPTIGEILDLGGGADCDYYYWSYVTNLMAEPYEAMVWLDDMGIDYESVTPFDVFALKWLDAHKRPDQKIQLSICQDALGFFLGKRNYDLGKTEDGNFVIFDLDNPSWGIGHEVFGWIHAFIKQINCFSDAGRIKPATASAKRILIDDMRDEARRRSRKRRDEESNSLLSHIGDSMADVIYGGSGAVTPFNIEQIKIYQLLSGARIAHGKVRVQSVMNGIHTGMIKSDKLDEKDLRWS